MVVTPMLTRRLSKGSLYALAMYLSISGFGLYGCKEMSEQIRDPTAGANGSFEIVRSGLPVNWLIYGPSTVPDSDFDVFPDTTTSVDGHQSLKFTVRTCSGIGGWKSPGFSQEYPGASGDLFNISFWVKSDGAEFQFDVGGVTAFSGERGPSVMSDSTLTDWHQYELEYTLPSDMDRLRVNFNVLSPGTLWIDDTRISRHSGIVEEPL